MNEVNKLPKANSPLFTDQWSVMGSAKLPYIVSRKDHADGSTTAECWCCSCPAFTRNTPREDCKHILKVKLKEGVSTAAAIGNLTGAQAAVFKKFLAQQAKEKRAEAANPGEVKMVGDSTGRKFR